MSAKSAAPGVEHRGAAEATNRERRILDSRARRAQARAAIAVAWRQLTAIAVRRCGELAKRIEPKNGGMLISICENEAIKVKHASPGVSQLPGDWSARSDLRPAPTRGQAARDAGLSPRQLKTALRVANVPKDGFERQVESEKPSVDRANAVIRLRPPRRGVEHVSAILDRIRQQLLLKMGTRKVRAVSAFMHLLRDPCCASCGEPAGRGRVCAIYVNDRGQRFPHVLCARCIAERSQEEIVGRVELRFAPAEGRA